MGRKPIVAHYKGQNDIHGVDREQAKQVIKNFVLENKNSKDPYFCKRDSVEKMLNLSDDLLFTLGQISIGEYADRIKTEKKQNDKRLLDQQLDQAKRKDKRRNLNDYFRSKERFPYKARKLNKEIIKKVRLNSQKYLVGGGKLPKIDDEDPKIFFPEPNKKRW